MNYEHYWSYTGVYTSWREWLADASEGVCGPVLYAGLRKHIYLFTDTGISEGGMTRLETLIDLKFLNSSFSSLSSYWN